MRYVTVATDSILDRLTLGIHSLCEANAMTMAESDTDEAIVLPHSPSEAWDVEEEGVLRYLGFVSIYYQKVHNPNAEDYRQRDLIPIETFESKAGALLMRCYDLNAGFVKSFRLDAVQRIMIRDQNLADDSWGLQDITFRVKENI